MSTIFAPITSEISASVNIIRISGPDALKALELFSIQKKIIPRFAYHTDFIYQDNLIDNGLFIFFKGPNSFTGEDVVELNIHGSFVIMKEFLNALNTIDSFRYAENGEFSKRAFINGKIDLLQAEAINDLVKSDTKVKSQQALKQLKGDVSNIYENWRKSLIDNLAILEAYIDFPDDDIDEALVKTINSSISQMIYDIKEFIHNNKNGIKINNGINIALIGSTNAGKSSLINELSGRDIAIVSEHAGTTRDVIETELDLNGINVKISDTAGIRETENEIEKIGIAKAITTAANADLRILLIDGSVSIKQSDLTNNLINSDDIIVINKNDILHNNNYSLLENKNILSISVKNKGNIDKLIDKISLNIKTRFDWHKGFAISKERHLIEIETIANYLGRFEIGDDLVLACENLRLAATALARITGKIDIEEILDKIFKEFCIGK